MRRLFAIFHARNLEFVRDRAAFGWHIAFPILLIIGFAFTFSDEGRGHFKVGILGQDKKTGESLLFLKTRYIDFVRYTSKEIAVKKVERHQLDMLIDVNTPCIYWVNDFSPKGYLVEKIFLGSIDRKNVVKARVSGKAIRYVDWVLPGILAMNVMFSCLYGVGYVIVRYRKNGVLKRFKATPLTAIEFLTAQVLSRLLIVLVSTVFVFIACGFFLNFYMAGSYWDLFVLTVLGTMSMIALGLLLTSRTKSEEFAGGLINLVSYPMMFLSGVWFSLEGSPEILQKIAMVFPLTHFIEGARKIMLDGASLGDIWVNLFILVAMTLTLLAMGSLRFDWGD